MNRVVFEWEGAWYETDYRFYKEGLKFIVLPNKTLLEHVGTAGVGKYMLSIPPEAFGFRKIEHQEALLSVEDLAQKHNAVVALSLIHI